MRPGLDRQRHRFMRRRVTHSSAECERCLRTARAQRQAPGDPLHNLRHTFATIALGAGTHPKIVSDRLGHANIAITSDSYSHVIEAVGEEAAAKIAALSSAIHRHVRQALDRRGSEDAWANGRSTRYTDPDLHRRETGAASSSGRAPDF